jgi:ATP-dependent Clp protease protease subunit
MRYDEYMCAQRKKFWLARHRWAPKPPESWASLNGDVNAAAVDKIIGALERAPDAPITLSIDSPGGDIHPALDLHAALRQHQAPVTTCAGRRCDSAALTIFLAGDSRVASQHSEFLVHGAARTPLGRPSAATLGAAAQELEALDQELRTLIAVRAGRYCGWELRADMKRERVLTAPEALARGIATALAG